MPAQHDLVLPDGTRVHLVEEGEGPLVVLVHGFPEGWWTWRAQLGVLARAGFRAVAVDVRGNGGSSAPAEIEAYRLVALAGDLLATVVALDAGPAVVVGHDWGSSIASTAALLRPDLVAAVALLGVPYQDPSPPGPRPSEAFAAVRGPQGEAFYVSHFQEPGVAEAEVERDVRGWLAGFYAALSAGPSRRPEASFVAQDATMADRFPPPAEHPAWLTDALLDEAAGALAASGLRGPLHRYRNADRDREDLRPFAGRPLAVPALFVAGAEDPSVAWLAPAIEAFPSTLPLLHGSHLLPGVGHWLQHEAPDELGRLLVGFLGALEHPRD